jgi:hypothetical protein
MKIADYFMCQLVMFSEAGSRSGQPSSLRPRAGLRPSAKTKTSLDCMQHRASEEDLVISSEGAAPPIELSWLRRISASTARIFAQIFDPMRTPRS